MLLACSLPVSHNVAKRVDKVEIDMDLTGDEGWKSIKLVQETKA